METSFNRQLNTQPPEDGNETDHLTAVPVGDDQETKPVGEKEIDWDAEIAREREEAKASKIMEQAVSVKQPEPQKEQVIDVQTEPDKKEDKPKDSKVVDASDVVFTDNGSLDDLRALADKIDEEDKRPVEMKEEDPNQDLIELAMCRTLGMRTLQHQLLTKLINAVDKNTQEVMDLKACVKELGLSRIKPNIPTTGGPKILTGDAAMATVIARTKGVFRIPLYNSGFWINMKPLSLSDLNAFYNEVDTDFKEFGRMIGSHYHLIFNIYTKKKLMDLVFENLISSNFDNYKNKQAFMDVVSINDYDTLAWALCTMMYPNGINIGVYCTNPECGHVDKSQDIDLAKCNFLNHDVLNADAVKWMMDGFTDRKPKTHKDLQHYRVNILKGSKTVKDNTGTNIYTFEVPTMQRYFEIGEELLNSIVESVHGERDTSNSRLYSEITYNVYKMLTPWISKMTMLDTNGATQFMTSDSAAIMESLDVHYGETSNVYKEIEDFLKDSRVNYIGITSLKCPKCGRVPNFAKDNMFVFDVEHLFFGLSYLRLGRIGETGSRG
jgi:hypothetical protein